MDNRLVSVLMPVYNGLVYLPQAVESILGQTHCDLELILWDDGSTERVWQHFDKVARGDSRVVLGHNRRNEGLTRCLNRCLRVARGELIARQDGDDWSLPTRLEKQAAALVDGIGLVNCWAYSVGPRGDRIPDEYLGRQARCDGSEVKTRLRTGNCLCDSASMYSREAVEAVGLFDETLYIGQTYNYSIRVAERFGVAVVPEELYVRRRHPGRVRNRHRAPPNLAERCRERARTHPVIREDVWPD